MVQSSNKSFAAGIDKATFGGESGVMVMVMVMGASGGEGDGDV